MFQWDLLKPSQQTRVITPCRHRLPTPADALPRFFRKQAAAAAAAQQQTPEERAAAAAKAEAAAAERRAPVPWGKFLVRCGAGRVCIVLACWRACRREELFKNLHAFDKPERAHWQAGRLLLPPLPPLSACHSFFSHSPPALRPLPPCSAPVWAVIVAHFCFNWGYYTLLAWLPSYFEMALGGLGGGVGGFAALAAHRWLFGQCWEDCALLRQAPPIRPGCIVPGPLACLLAFAALQA